MKIKRVFLLWVVPLLALIRKDLKGYFDQPTGYILILVFTVLLSYLFFRSAMVSLEVSLRPLFTFLPWVLVIFVPAATMRLISEEERDGTLEILFTQPISGWSVVFAKFVGGLSFVSLGIAGTIAIPLFLSTAGDIDVGAIIGQYLGSILLAGALVSIGLFCSSLSRNQIVAFMVGVTINGILMLLGMDIVLHSVSSKVGVIFHGLSPLSHFSNVARGVLPFRDVLYFVVLTTTFLAMTYLMVRSKNLSHKSGLYHNLQVGVVGLVVASLLVGWFGDSIGGRWDFTNTNRYSMDPATVSLVSDTDDLVTFKLFSSEEIPAEYAFVKRETEDFLNDLENVSDNVRLIQINPDEDSQSMMWAESSGIAPVEFRLFGEGEFQLKRFYLGLSITYLDNQEVIPFVESIESLEYQVASRLNHMARPKPKTIAFMAGYGSKSKNDQYNAFVTQLEIQYQVLEVEMDDDSGLDLTQADIVIIPSPSEQIPVTIIDQLITYLGSGGSVLVLMESANVIQAEGRLIAQRNTTGLSPLLDEFNVGFGGNLVYDARSNRSVPVSSGSGSYLIPYGYWPRVFVDDSIGIGSVQSIVVPWASSLFLNVHDLTDTGMETIPLLTTSQYAGTDASFAEVSPGMDMNVIGDQGGQHTVGAAIVGGTFQKDPSEQTTVSPIYRLVVIGDAEWLSDPMIELEPENLVFGLDLVDWLAQEDVLAGIRSKLPFNSLIRFDSVGHGRLVEYGGIVTFPILLCVAGVVRFIARRNLGKRIYQRVE